jgi:hypothetical protein
VLDKFFGSEHFVKTWPNSARQRPNLRRRRRCNSERKLPFSKDDGFKIRHGPYKLSRSISPYSFKIPHNFFETLSKALHGVEHKMNYLKSVVQTPV